MNQTLSYLFLKLQAMALLVFNRKADALVRFDAMLALRPADFYALASRAHVLAQLGRRADALVAQEQLSALHPDNLAAWCNLGYMLRRSWRARACRGRVPPCH